MNSSLDLYYNRFVCKVYSIIIILFSYKELTMALDPKTKETVREEALRLSKEFAALDGRRPRVLLIEMEMISKAIVKNETCSQCVG